MLNSAFMQNQESYFGVKKYVGYQFNLTSSFYLDYYYGAQNHNLQSSFSILHSSFLILHS